jgi:hypothetical protein
MNSAAFAEVHRLSLASVDVYDIGAGQEVSVLCALGAGRSLAPG